MKTGDEIEALAAQFNQMTGQLQESYATLEQKVEERTRALTEALAQQTATAEILRVTSSSPTDAQPVSDAIAQSALRLCDGLHCAVFRVDGELLRLVAIANLSREGLGEFTRAAPMPLSAVRMVTLAVREQRVVMTEDLQSDPRASSESRHLARALGFRGQLCVPMMREGAAVGVIAVTRRETGRFTDKQIELVKTFADQAVIAIENVRLFTELQARTAALSRSVKELTALGEVSQALTLYPAPGDGAGHHRRSHQPARQRGRLHNLRVRRGDRGVPTVASERRLRAGIRGGHPPAGDPQGRGDHEPGRRPAGVGADRRHDVGSSMTAPCGTCCWPPATGRCWPFPSSAKTTCWAASSSVARPPAEFPADVVNLLQTFATQSALAIQNARLFREIEDKSRQLEVASPTQVGVPGEHVA